MAHEEEELQHNVIPYQLYESTLTSQILTFYISSDLGPPDLYVDMIQTIRTASADDEIFIVLNMRGGQLATGIQIINAMRSSAAKITTVVEGECHSMGTLIFLAGDECVVNPNSIMLFHNFSSGGIGKGNEQMAQIEASVDWYTELCNDFYYPFLSNEEIARMLEGVDFWMGSTEIKKRLELIETIQEKDEAAEDETVSNVAVQQELQLETVE